MISIEKLSKLPRKTRLRKIVLLLQAEERELQGGGEPHRNYLGFICGMLALDGKCGPGLTATAEACRRLCEEGAPDPVRLRRRVNRLRHALLRCLGAEPAEWDLLCAASEELDAGVRTVAPMQVYLEEIRSPYNVGAIFRSSEAFAVEQLLLSPLTASPLHPRALKSARGAIKIMPWRFAELSELAGLENRSGIFALEVGGTHLGDFRFPERGIMLVGSEELGLSPESLALAADGAGRVTIPMAGAKRSLNVAVAAGIVLQAWYSSVMGRRNEPSATEEKRHTTPGNTATDEPSVL